MSVYSHRLFLQVTCSVALALTSFVSTSPAQTQLPSLNASITLKNGRPQNYILNGCDQSSILVAGGSGVGQASLPVDTIENITIIPPSAYSMARQAIDEGDYAKAESLMVPHVNQLVPYIDLPGSNAGNLLFEYGESLRNAARLTETAKFYKSLSDRSKNDSFIQQATAAYAYALTGLNKYDEAAAAIKNAKPLSRTDLAFPFDKLARARMQLAQKKYQAALDQCAQLLVYFRISEPWYPEAQYIAAEAYSGLAESLKKTNALDAENYDAAGQSIYLALYSFSPKSQWAKMSDKKLREKPQGKKDKKGERATSTNKEENAEPKEEMPFSDLPITEEKPKDEMQ